MMPSSSVAPAPIKTFFQVFMTKMSTANLTPGSGYRTAKHSTVAHERIRSDEGESSNLPLDRPFPACLRLASEGRPCRNSLYRARCPDNCPAYSTARHGFLRGLEEGPRAGNLFLTGHFFLPCCIQ